MKLIGYSKCSTCQKAKKWLEEQNINFAFREIKTENPSVEELKLWQEKSGLPLKKFFNTSGLLYKSMNLKDKLAEMTEEEQYSLLAGDGMLVKRPLLVAENFVLVGFKEADWKEKLL
ncbi:MAG: arsenate reductase family protein [Eubacteriales bacterium]|nr:arsenate reductase family protein [Eubacteriales bacterium]